MCQIGEMAQYTYAEMADMHVIVKVMRVTCNKNNSLVV
jgi:hypothetical protein